MGQKKRSASQIGRFSRNKGAAAEREIAQAFRDKNIDPEAHRQLESQQGFGRDLALPNIGTYSIQIKRHKRVGRALLDMALQEAVRGCTKGYKIPVVVFRDNKDFWKACMKFDDFLDMISKHEKLIKAFAGLIRKIKHGQETPSIFYSRYPL